MTVTSKKKKIHYNIYANRIRDGDTMEKRKNIRLPNFDYTVGTYFVTVCSKDRKNIFGCIPPNHIVGDGLSVPILSSAGEVLDKWIGMISQKFPNVQIQKYVIMPNHLHMIVHMEGTDDPSPTLGNIMGWFKYGATKEINQITGNGIVPVFQRSYHDHVIRNEKDYLRIWQYIDENPAKWDEDKYYTL